MKQKLLLLSSMVVVLMGGALMLSSTISPVDASQMMCTQEAKLCPDGVSYVSRTGPNCEFAACPSNTGTVCTQEAKLCPDGVTYVGRSGPNCEFAACPSNTGTVCTQEAKLCPDGVTYVGRSGPNCTFEICPSSGQTVCTQEAKLCPDGVNYVSRTGPNCEFAACPVTTGPACTEEYAPVCGEPPMPDCLPGRACVEMMPLPKTYSNKCYMNAAGATYLYAGECKDSSTGPACTEEYAPVCGQPLQTSPYEGISAPQTYSNKCYMNAAGARYLYTGECTTYISPEYSELTQSQIERLESKLSSLVITLENKYTSVEKKEAIVMKMISIVEARPELRTVYKKASARQQAISYVLNYLKGYYSDLISGSTEYAPD